MRELSSPQNPEVKHLASLQDRRGRQKSGEFLVEGARESLHALKGGVDATQLYRCPELHGPQVPALLPELTRAGLPSTRLSPAAFAKISRRQNPDGVLLRARAHTPVLPPLPESALLLVTVGVEKPGNLGALLRTADGAGVSGALLAGETEPYNPNTIRASQGAVFSVPLGVMPEDEALAWLEGQGFRLLAATPEAERTLWETDYRGRVAVCLGAEDSGLPPHWKAASDGVSIPMRGGADSLNVGVSGALLLYEALRQRG